MSTKYKGMLNVSLTAAFRDDARMVGLLQGNAAIPIQRVVDLHSALGDAQVARTAIGPRLNLIPIGSLHGFRARLRFWRLRAQSTRHGQQRNGSRDGNAPDGRQIEHMSATIYNSPA